jgi:hypothetical protein
MMIAEAVAYLGPARVLAASGRPDYIQIALLDRGQERLWARIAIVPCELGEGDEVLVIRHQSAEAYVIGLLASAGATKLRVAKDLQIEAPKGEIRIVAGKGVLVHGGQWLEMNAPRATLRFARLNVLVKTLVQRLSDSYTWATGLVQLKGRRVRSIADEGWLLRSGHAHVKTTDNIHIAGKTVHLG